MTLAALLTTAVVARRWLAPGWHGAMGRLAELTLAGSALIACAQLLGLVGQLRGWTITAASALLAAIALIARPDVERTSRRRRPRPLRSTRGRTEPVALFGLAMITVSAWTSTVGLALRKGMYDFDTLVYHGPFAARFAQSASTAGLHQITTGQAIAYHPANAELLNAAGILFMSSDVLTVLGNLVWLAVGALALWCGGERWRVGGVALACAAPLLTAPGVVTSQAGTGGNDLAATAWFVAGIAFAARARETRGARLLAALAGGLAVGTKLSLVVPVAALTVFVVAQAPKRLRAVAAAAWLVPAALTGAYWYLRNAAITGNPIPALRVGVGPLQLNRPDMPIVDRFSGTVLFDLRPEAWSTVYRPALDSFFGPLWWLLLPVAIGGLVVGVADRSDRVRQGLALSGLVAALGYAITPTTGEDVVFEANLRYALPALLTGLLMVATHPIWRSREMARCGVIATAGLATGVAFVDQRVWGLPGWSASTCAGIATIAVGALVVEVSRRLAVDARRLRGPFVVAFTALAIVGGPVALHGAGSRYVDARYAGAEGELGAAFRWARSIESVRIGVVGAIEHYPLHGRRLTNHVQYIAVERADTSFAEIRNCRDWRVAIDAGRYDFVVVSRSPLDVEDYGPPAELAWARADPTLELVVDAGNTTVWSVERRGAPTSC